MEDRLLDKKELAKYLACSVRQVDYHRKEDNLPCLKIGNIVRFRLSEVDAWLAKYAVRSQSK